MDPLSMGIGAAGSVLSSVTSAISAAAQRKWQSEENQKDRDFNSNEAKLQRQYNTQMVNAQNDYNNPRAVMSRLSAAGINPALAYSNGAGSVLGSVGIGSSSQASHNGSYGGSLPDFSSIADIGLKAAQTENIEADTDKKREEERQLAIDNIYRDIKNQKEINYQDVMIDLGKSQINMTDEQADNLAAQTWQIGEMVLQIRDNRALTQAETDQVRRNLFEQEKTFDDRASSLASQAKIDIIKARNLQREIDAAVADMYASVGVKVSETSLNQKRILTEHWHARSVYWDAKNSKIAFKQNEYLAPIRTAHEEKMKNVDMDWATMNMIMEHFGRGVHAAAEGVDAYQKLTTYDPAEQIENYTETRENFDRRGRRTGSTTTHRHRNVRRR